MLGLQIAAPMNGVVEGIVVRLQQLDRLGVGDMAKIGGQHMVQAIKQPFVYELIEEGHFLRGIFQHVGDDILDHVLGQTHIVREVCKGDLRLNHPELRGVALEFSARKVGPKV